VRLTIVLPSYKAVPIGGYRVHYEYANRLAARGHAITIVARVPSRRQRVAVRCRGRRRGLRRLVAWFDFDPRIRLEVDDGRGIPQCDVAVVTAWATAEAVPTIRSRARGVVQIAYDYEYWMLADRAKRERMSEAFALPDVVVATSHAVARMLKEAGREPDATITCGIDPEAFHIVRDPDSRDMVAGFVARPGPIKRCEDAVAALARVRETRAVRVVAVGTVDVDLPPWVERLEAPSDDAMRSFYNELAVFLLPSAYEGWGLTAVEAMACGAAVVTTRNGGVEDFARDGVNALLVPPQDPDALARACARLLDDKAMRTRIADRGVQTARDMDWEASIDAFEKILETFR
jgi:L-malate glycosyltransferase